MKELMRIAPYTPIIMILTAYVCIIYEAWTDVKPLLSKKDCMVAEFSPDFSQKEKELCRELRGKK